MHNETITPLTRLLRACTDEQRAWLATRAGTSVGYLYALAGCHRECPNARLAVNIEDASRELHDHTQGVTPIVSARELAMMCLVSDLGSV